MNQEKYNKILEELWDNGNISYNEIKAINILIKDDSVDLNKRWNIHDKVKELQVGVKQ